MSTWNAQYKAARAAVTKRRRMLGLCVARVSCKKRIYRSGLCKTHWTYQRERERVNSKRRYLARKIAGVCVYSTCKAQAQGDSLMCRRHDAVVREYQRGSAYRASARRGRKAWERRKWRAGLCIICGSETRAARKLGLRCLEKTRIRNCLRGQSGKRVARLLAGLRVDDYATARNEVV